MRIVALCLLLAALLLPAHQAAAQEVKLKVNLQFPLGHPALGANLKLFKEEVERRSEGAIGIDIFAGKDLLFNDDEVVEAVVSGKVDMGMTAAHQFAVKVPLVGILDQPFLFNFEALMTAAAKPGSEIRRLIDAAILETIGVRTLWWTPIGNNVFFSKGVDLTDPAHMKDMRVAAPGKLPGEFVSACGGKAAVITMEKVKSAYEAGQLDMAVTGFGAALTYGLTPFTDTITFTDHTPIEFFYVINEKKWRALKPEHQAIITEAVAKVDAQFSDSRAVTDKRARDFAAKNNIALKELTPDQIAEWRACSAGMLAEYMDRAGEGGRKLMAAYAKLRTDPCCSTQPGSSSFTRH